MDSNYDKIKKVLADDSQPLPPDLEWERMEAGILQKMDELQAASAQETAATRRKWAVIGWLLALFLIPLFCIRFTQDTSSETPVDSRHPLVQEGLKQSASPVMPSTVVPKIPVEERSTSPAKHTIENDSEKETTAALPGDAARPDTVLKPLATTAKATPENQETIASQQLAAPRTFGADENRLPNQQTPVAVQRPARAATTHPHEPVASVLGKESESEGAAPFLETKLFVVERRSEPPVFLLHLENAHSPNETPTPKDRLADRLFLTSGISLSNMGYGRTQPERYAYESSIPSVHAQVNYVHTFKRNFTGLIGLQFQQLHTRFDWQESITDHTVTLTDTIIQLRVNSFTGQQEEVRGDVEVPVAAKRVVRHYNSTRLYQIPVAVGKTWAAGQWRMDVLVGGTLNIHTMNQGRTLYQDELQTFQGSSTDFMASQWKVQAMLMGRLSYQLTDRIGLTTGMQFQKSLHDWSKEAEVNMRPLVMNGEIGLFYAF